MWAPSLVQLFDYLHMAYYLKHLSLSQSEFWCLVMADIQDGSQHNSWSKMITRGYIYPPKNLSFSQLWVFKCWLRVDLIWPDIRFNKSPNWNSSLIGIFDCEAICWWTVFHLICWWIVDLFHLRNRSSELKTRLRLTVRFTKPLSHGFPSHFLFKGFHPMKLQFYWTMFI